MVAQGFDEVSKTLTSIFFAVARSRWPRAGAAVPGRPAFGEPLRTQNDVYVAAPHGNDAGD
jgi:hypothetical protein